MDPIIAQLPQDLQEDIKLLTWRRSRRKEVIAKKESVIVRLREEFHMAYPVIARLLRYCDHTTVRHLYMKVRGDAAIHNLPSDTRFVSPFAKRATGGRPSGVVKHTKSVKDRAASVAAAVLKAGTMTSVASEMGLSRERIRQLCEIALPGFGIAMREMRKQETLQRNERRCFVCGKVFYRYEKALCCSRECSSTLRPKLTPEQKAEKVRIGWKKYTASHQRRLETDKEYRDAFNARQAAYRKEWARRKMKDPVYRAAYLARAKARYAALTPEQKKAQWERRKELRRLKMGM